LKELYGSEKIAEREKMLDVLQFSAITPKKEYIYLLDTSRVIHYALRKFIKLGNNNEARNCAVKVIANVASAVTELAKSALIGVELRCYSQTAVAAGLWAVALDIFLDFSSGDMERNNAIIEVWENLVLEMFGDGSMAKIESFGWYLMKRQKCIYETYGKKSGCINKIYTSDSCAIFESK